MKSRMILGALALLIQTAVAGSASAQHPVEVQRLAASGDYFVALTTFERMPKRVATTQSVMAAARSAWALGLSSRAIEEFDRALRDEKLAPEDQARIYLSKGIIEFQEGRYQVAALHSEKCVETLNAMEGAGPNPLRAKAYLLWGDSLSKLNSLGDAEQKYVQALDDAASDDQPQINFSLGKCRAQIGKYEQARENFELVPLNHELTADTIRNLASLALDTGKISSATFWLQRGRSEYPDSFLDSWVDYALVKSAISENNLPVVREIRAGAAKKYPPSDQWLILLQAAAEEFEWSKRAAESKEGQP
ncbi:MAG: tetratricopeptide repeat protein [Deltaproteobacteria bacterium]|nr:tetratricopeptide repeat protein [Deltaproteobacteria bacterium]